jgi:hypothetical protein
MREPIKPGLVAFGLAMGLALSAVAAIDGPPATI